MNLCCMPEGSHQGTLINQILSDSGRGIGARLYVDACFIPDFILEWIRALEPFVPCCNIDGICRVCVKHIIISS